MRRDGPGTDAAGVVADPVIAEGGSKPLGPYAMVTAHES